MLDGEYSKERDQIRNLMQNSSTFDELFLYGPLDVDAHREQTLRAVKELIALKTVHLRDMVDNPKKFLMWFETISYCDPSVALKFAVQYNLWGGTILLLGTKKHHDRYLQDISDGKLLGVFGLTELGHGSNVNGLETTATFDLASKSFIINSPTWTSQKYWPGNISKHGKLATIFARLILGGVDKGVHAFVVPIRSEPTVLYPYGEVLEGVTIRDISYKSSYNGIDNGGLLFKNVKIPLENMLDRFSSVDENGKYHSEIPSNRHFGAMMSVFFIGRVCLSLLSLCSMKVGVAIALSYAYNRLQFGPPKQAEQPIINYTTTQRRLIPSIARAYAYDFAHKAISEPLGRAQDVLHSYSSGIKAFTSWDSVAALQLAREVAGGQGIRLHTRIGMLREHSDLVVTGEGDNTVLCQQVAKFLLAQYHKAMQSGSFSGELAYVNNLTGTTPSQVPIDLLSLSYQQLLLEHREYILVKELYQKIYGNNKTLATNSLEFYNKFNENLTLTIKVAKANVDRLVQGFFLDRIIKLTNTDPTTLTLLKNLCRLDSLVQIQKELGFYFNYNLLSSQKLYIQIDDTITQLCKDITPYSKHLTSAFAIPNKFHPLLNSIE
ncbi:hypothetical protein DLAC_08191 [Tieghemostelium lacteum]|uniref:Acyl-coenzyme A oxidase n=1 Tax=Tieghemostelium lacteum TaxID=361077 RepID=A0A151ZBE0_TIELA|nr:hypothetical protein DLAC_08191 [Tieghemostelium lacteum]|eukprot:KYQ91256.1 hypothetical protein DLAC_08191 [Tieghemostelium lacteum]